MRVIRAPTGAPSTASRHRARRCISRPGNSRWAHRRRPRATKATKATKATTVTPGAWHLARMLEALDTWPVRRASRRHEDWGSTPAAIDPCLSVADASGASSTACGVNAQGLVVAEPDGAGRAGLSALRSEAPLLLRVTSTGLHLVGGAAGLVGGDRIRLDLDLRAAAVSPADTAPRSPPSPPMSAPSGRC